MITNFQSPNLQREIIRKKKKKKIRFSPIHLLIILFQQTKFEVPSYDSFRDIRFTNFQSQNLQREAKFEAHSCDSFRDIIITNFQSPNLQREIIRKK